ncbi:hypothetical protein H6P81_013535 [Aristolochia fimbriata]|uniref:Uncharacterized protein n=1 Tax=Aristolochia fimbriata TaxID=158543 RepID=A0AAV7EI94_ARIFI|nr:hypothetical protein H6P81_013535 [Aristolochia fimbriata]
MNANRWMLSIRFYGKREREWKRIRNHRLMMETHGINQARCRRRRRSGNAAATASSSFQDEDAIVEIEMYSLQCTDYACCTSLSPTVIATVKGR